MYKVKEKREKKSDVKKNLGGARAKAVCVLGRVRASTELSALASACSYGTCDIPSCDRSSQPVAESLRACENSVTDRTLASIDFHTKLGNSERKASMVKLDFRLFA